MGELTPLHGEQKYANIRMLRFTTHAEPPQFVVACCDDFEHSRAGLMSRTQ
ncbi:MAG: hypothetical protein ABWY20_13845 [Mycobacterium sp.]